MVLAFGLYRLGSHLERPSQRVLVGTRPAYQEGHTVCGNPRTRPIVLPRLYKGPAEHISTARGISRMPTFMRSLGPRTLHQLQRRHPPGLAGLSSCRVSSMPASTSWLPLVSGMFRPSGSGEVRVSEPGLQLWRSECSYGFLGARIRVHVR